MWESRRDFQRVWEEWKAGFMAFHAFHALSFPWPALGAGSECEVSETLFAEVRERRTRPPSGEARSGGHFTRSTSGSDQLLSKNGSSGPYQRNIGEKPLFATVLTQLLSKSLGAVGPK
jgi:hypothetical protein